MSKIQAAITMKCPRCQEGQVFETVNPYVWGKMTQTKERCPKCDLKYERESGFFYGAMYISYMLNIALFVTATVGYYLYFEDKVDWRLYIGGYVLITFILFPVIFRLSRAIWLQIMVKFEPETRKKVRGK